MCMAPLDPAALILYLTDTVYRAIIKANKPYRIYGNVS